jgi:hypothetical protein
VAFVPRPPWTMTSLEPPVAALPYVDPDCQPASSSSFSPSFSSSSSSSRAPSSCILYKVYLATEPSCDNASAMKSSSVFLPAAVLTCTLFISLPFETAPWLTRRSTKYLQPRSTHRPSTTRNPESSALPFLSYSHLRLFSVIASNYRHSSSIYLPVTQHDS